MTVQTFIEILQQIPDKDIPIIMPVEGAFLTVCTSDSGIVTDDEGRAVFVIMPCFGHLADEEIEIEVRADDFDENLN